VEALLARSISFHFMENGIYEDRCNPNEQPTSPNLSAASSGRRPSSALGWWHFEASTNEIENALSRLADEDSDFAARLEADYVREENDVFLRLVCEEPGERPG